MRIVEEAWQLIHWSTSMELHDALTQIAEIRQQMARGQLFRGYRAATTAFSGLLAIAAGVAQWAAIPVPEAHPLAYVLLWTGAAVLSLAMMGVEMTVRIRRSNSAVQRQLTFLAIEQFLPSVMAGALMTYLLCAFLQQHLMLLPGLWMVLFSLGVFASSRLLPRAVFGIGGFYMIAGVWAMVVSGQGWAFSPWLMAGVFSAGQLATAAILYLKLERGHE